MEGTGAQILSSPSLSELSRRQSQKQATNKQLNFVDNRDFKELFTMFDKDGGGSIDEEEFTAMLKVLGINIKFPKDPDDPITFPELCALLTHLSNPLTREEELREAFRFFTQDAEIRPENMMAAYEALGDDTLTMRDARSLLGMGPEMTAEEREELKEHGAGLADDSQGMPYAEFEYRILMAQAHTQMELARSTERSEKRTVKLQLHGQMTSANLAGQ